MRRLAADPVHVVQRRRVQVQQGRGARRVPRGGGDGGEALVVEGVLGVVRGVGREAAAG